MWLKQKDLIIIRSFPIPQDEADIQRCIHDFISSVYLKHEQTFARVAKAIRLARKMGMSLPVYLKPLTEEGKALAAELLDLYTNQDRKAELVKYEKDTPEEQKAGGRLILFLDRVENLV